jgi:hypothetical protein
MRSVSRFAHIAAAAGLAVLVAASPSAAQTPDGHRQLTDKQAAQELAIYAKCIASQRADRARALALAPYGSAEQDKAAASIVRGIDDMCLQSGFDSVRVSVRADVLAGAVANELLHREYPDLPAVVDRRLVDIEAERQRAALLSVPERFGRCVVWNDPGGVSALLSAEPGSGQERVAVEGLKDDLGMCLEEGSTVRLDRSFVRTIAAVSAYRLAQQIRPRSRGVERG